MTISSPILSGSGCTARSRKNVNRNGHLNGHPNPRWSSQVSFQTAHLKRNLKFDHGGFRSPFWWQFQVSFLRYRAVQKCEKCVPPFQNKYILGYHDEISSWYTMTDFWKCIGIASWYGAHTRMKTGCFLWCGQRRGLARVKHNICIYIHNTCIYADKPGCDICMSVYVFEWYVCICRHGTCQTSGILRDAPKLHFRGGGLLKPKIVASARSQFGKIRILQAMGWLRLVGSSKV